MSEKLPSFAQKTLPIDPWSEKYSFLCVNEATPLCPARLECWQALTLTIAQLVQRWSKALAAKLVVVHLKTVLARKRCWPSRRQKRVGLR